MFCENGEAFENKGLRNVWCPGEDLNLHGVTPTST
jgi:hypothetical protein